MVGATVSDGSQLQNRLTYGRDTLQATLSEVSPRIGYVQCVRFMPPNDASSITAGVAANVYVLRPSEQYSEADPITTELLSIFFALKSMSK